jgi:glycine/D-amino acid oxidase-like deaminating enzyme
MVVLGPGAHQIMASPDMRTSFISKLSSDPGLPHENPTVSAWQTPPHPELASIQSPSLPAETDTVIIGSGITGCSVASTLLERELNSTVTILEARTICSGATGRNGGHVKSAAVSDYAFWEPKIGKAAAKKIIAFTFQCSDALFEAAASLPETAQEAAEMRKVESITVLTDPGLVEEGRASLKMFEEDNPEWKGKYRFVEKDEATTAYGLPGAAAAYIGPAGAAWPYRLVTAVYTKLLSDFPSRFKMEANTPVLSVSGREASSTHKYSVATTRGRILANRVIYCTNGHAAHLLPGLRGKLFPVRGHMTVQSPKYKALLDNPRNQSWGIIHSPGLDYMTQNVKTGELFLGGGLFQSEQGGLVDVGSSDDSELSKMATSHLINVLPAIFGDHNDAEKEELELKANWSGIMGFTSDGSPIVGRLPPSVTEHREGGKAAAGGEWIAAGFNGYGMVNAWLAGRAVAQMALGDDVGEWLPENYVCSESRLAQMKAQDFAEAWFGGETENQQAVET